MLIWKFPTMNFSQTTVNIFTFYNLLKLLQIFVSFHFLILPNHVVKNYWHTLQCSEIFQHWLLIPSWTNLFNFIINVNSQHTETYHPLVHYWMKMTGLCQQFVNIQTYFLSCHWLTLITRDLMLKSLLHILHLNGWAPYKRQTTCAPFFANLWSWLQTHKMISLTKHANHSINILPYISKYV